MSSVGLCCFKVKEQTQISALEYKITNRQKKFGVDYLTLVQRSASPAALKDCLKEAMNDVSQIRAQVHEHRDNIQAKETQVQQQQQQQQVQSTSSSPPAAAADTDRNVQTPKKKKKPKKKQGPDERFTIDDE